MYTFYHDKTQMRLKIQLYMHVNVLFYTRKICKTFNHKFWKAPNRVIDSNKKYTNK